MLKMVPFDPIHVDFCRVHPDFAAAMSRESPDDLARSREAWSLIDADSGDVVAMLGAVETHEDVFFLWCYTSVTAGTRRARSMLTRFAQDALKRIDAVRFECVVIKDCRQGHRWMRFLGFRRETTRPMKNWDGYDAFHLYSKVKAV